MADHEHTGSDPISGPADRAVDDRLRAAGARLRATAPSAGGVAPPGANGRRRDSRRWYVAAGVMAAAAALVAILIVLPRGDETVRQVPSDTAPTSPTVPTDPDEPPITTPDPTVPTTEPDTSIPDPIVQLVTDESLDDWDGAGGACLTLVLHEPLEPREIPACVTGNQLAATAVAYIRGEQYAYGWSGRRGPDGRMELALSGGGFAVSGGEYPVFGTPAPPCGPPQHELPADQWYLVSNCADGAALYTPLPAGPTETADEPVLVGAERSTTPLPATPVPTFGGSNDPFTLYEVQIDLASELALPDRCVIAAPDGASPWFEMCGDRDEARYNGVFLHDGLPYALEDVEVTRVVPLDRAAFLPTHGCSTPVVDVLDGMADPDGMLGEFSSLVLTGLVCTAASSPFDNPAVDLSAAAFFSGVHLRQGPLDGGLVVFDREGPGPWTVTDTGTGIDLEVWPQSIPPAESFSTDTDLLPPIDVTETLRDAVGDAETIEGLVAAIEAYLLGLHEPEAGDPPVATQVPGLPTHANARSLVIAELRYLDDATSSGTYSIWIAPPFLDEPARVEQAYVTNRCGRGVTESEGVLLCV